MCKHQPGIWAESVNWKTNMVNEKGLIRHRTKRLINRRGLSHVPGFQGRTGDEEQ